MHKLFAIPVILALLSCTAIIAKAQDAVTPPATTVASTGGGSGDSSLLSLDLNDLMNIKVTTTSKKAESFNKVAASLYVVTADDIRRSGAQNIPEALRLVPGVSVAQLTSARYAISIRGFNSQFSDQLLVLIDGRTIYNNLYGGVFWEDQQIPMDDIDRIEVIRGPGTAIWGANAVQGIINIITKNAKDTQGLTATAEYGDSTNKNSEQVGYGGAYGKDGYYRLFGKVDDLGSVDQANGATARDSWTDQLGGFRLDQGSEDKGKVQLSGDLFKNVTDTVGLNETNTAPWLTSVNGTYPDTGGDLVGHYEKLQSNGSTLSAQADYTTTNHYMAPVLKADINTENVDVQDSLAQIGQHSIIFGLGYKTTNTTINGISLLGSPRTAVSENSESGYFQDQMTLSKTLSAQIGSKFEHDSFSGWEYEPSAHLGYTPDDQHTVWISASRAVKIPSLADIGFTLDTGAEVLPGPTLITEMLQKGKHVDSAIITAYEAGYRVQASSRVLIDLSGFYNQYSEILGLNPDTVSSPSPAGASLPPGTYVVPASFSNLGSGNAYGGEIVSHVRFTPKWRVNFGYSYLYAQAPPAEFQGQINTPNSQTEVQSYLDLTKKIELDSAAYFVGANKETATHSYTKLDLRLGYHPSSKCEISVGGNNLLENHSYQFISGAPFPSYEIEREFYTKISWKY